MPRDRRVTLRRLNLRLNAILSARGCSNCKWIGMGAPRCKVCTDICIRSDHPKLYYHLWEHPNATD